MNVNLLPDYDFEHIRTLREKWYMRIQTPRLSEIDVVHPAVRTLVIQYQMQQPVRSKIDQLFIGVNELFINAVVHGNREDPSKIIELAFGWFDLLTIHFFYFGIRDQGNGVDVDDPEFQDASPGSGHGLKVARANLTHLYSHKEDKAVFGVKLK